jgi:hypothetical protein
LTKEKFFLENFFKKTVVGDNLAGWHRCHPPKDAAQPKEREGGERERGEMNGRNDS